MSGFGEQRIQLQNPVSDHFETWIAGNAAIWQERAMQDIKEILDAETYAELLHEYEQHKPGLAFGENQTFHDFILPFAESRYAIKQGEAKGQHVVICGAGPTLRETAKHWCHKGDQVWGCNSALTWLLDNGYKCTHGLTVDQTPHMCEEWASTPDVEYLVASTIHPNLAELLRQNNRHARYFHNFVGLKKPPVAWPDSDGKTRHMGYEQWLYALLFPPSGFAGAGLNTASRAIDVAEWMGFEKITLLGADCALEVLAPQPDAPFGSPEHTAWLKTSVIMHADGSNALSSGATPVTLGGEICPLHHRPCNCKQKRYWLTKPDMMITAVWLENMRRRLKNRLRIVGDTLPNALRGKPKKYLDRLPSLIDSAGNNLPAGE